MSEIRLSTAPFGLRTIDVYDDIVRGELRVGLRTMPDARRTYIVVTDEDRNVAADAICDIDNPEIEEAKQWLLDFTRCSL